MIEDFVDIERGVVDPRLVVVERLEDDGAATMPHQLRRSRRRLEHGTARGEIAAENGDAAGRSDRPVERTDDLVVEALGAGAVLADRRAVGVAGIAIEQARFEQAPHHHRQAAGGVEILHHEGSGRH